MERFCKPLSEKVRADVLAKCGYDAENRPLEPTPGEAANMVFWGCSDEADGYADGANPILADRAQDRMRLYWLTTRKGGDGRAWSKISTTLDLTGANPKKLAVLISPELCTDGRWLGEDNGEVVWCYTRADASGAEKDSNGATIWHPAEPVKWFRTLPEWAE